MLEWVAISFSKAWKWKVKVTLSRVWLSDPMDFSPPGSSVHGIFQARVLECGAIAFSSTWSNPINNLTFLHSLVCMAINSPSFVFTLFWSALLVPLCLPELKMLELYEFTTTKSITNSANPHIHRSRLCITVEPKHKIPCASLPLNLSFFQDRCLCKWHPDFSAPLLKPKTWKLSSASKATSSISDQVLSTLVPTYF